MLITTHAFAGAAIGCGIATRNGQQSRLVPPLWLAAPLAFGSHFLMDHYRHFEPASSWQMWEHALVATIEIVACAALCLWAWFAIRHRFWPIVVGALMGVAPDLMRGWPWLVSLPVLTTLNWAHGAFHAPGPAATWYTGLWGQVLIVAVAVWVLARASVRERVAKRMPSAA